MSFKDGCKCVSVSEDKCKCVNVSEDKCNCKYIQEFQCALLLTMLCSWADCIEVSGRRVSVRMQNGMS
jgi:hypothetical protein